MTADACRMHSLPDALYVPVFRSRARTTALWRLVKRQFEADPALHALPRDCDRRKARAVLEGLWRCRDYLTGKIDADLERIGRACDYGVSAVAEGLQLLRGLGYLEIIPRRRYDKEAARPAPYRGRGWWHQWTNAYEVTTPDTPRRWPQFAPEPAADEVEFTAEDFAAMTPLSVEERAAMATALSVPEKQAPSRADHTNSLIDAADLPKHPEQAVPNTPPTPAQPPGEVPT